MKKIILTAVAVTLALSLAACTGKTNDAKAPSSSPSTSASQEGDTASILTFMGEVKDKVGNDLTISLGNLILENDGGEGQAMMVDENGNQVPVDDLPDGTGGEMVLIPVPDDEDGETAEGSGEIEKLPIEFIGEVRDFTIPAGAKIVNSMGKEVSLDNIKKGSLVQLIVNEASGIVETVMVF